MKAATPLLPVSWARMIRTVEKVRDRLSRTTAALEGAGVPYLVIDDPAVAAWVARVDEAAVRNTRDVDILLRRADLAAARDALETAGFIYRHVSSPGQPGGLDFFLDGPGASVRDAVHVVFAAEKARADSLAASPDVTESELADQFRLVSLEGLVRMKLAAFRDKDRIHLRDLIEVGLVDASWFTRLEEPELRARLQAILDSPED